MATRQTHRKTLIKRKFSYDKLIKNVWERAQNSGDLQSWAESDIGRICNSAIRLPPPPFFLSGCLVWSWLCIPGRHAAISARASRSRMAALRGVLWRAVQVRAWQWQSFFCSFTTQSALQGLKLLCSVMDNTQIHTKITHGHMHTLVHKNSV